MKMSTLNTIQTLLVKEYCKNEELKGLYEAKLKETIGTQEAEDIKVKIETCNEEMKKYAEACADFNQHEWK